MKSKQQHMIPQVPIQIKKVISITNFNKLVLFSPIYYCKYSRWTQLKNKTFYVIKTTTYDTTSTNSNKKGYFNNKFQ